ncbi:fused response regulator/phosphatase [Exilibacterium tricleocarpae]|uniref:Fused response regulator/phosphatase n=1 Tax=Exilibacterium tricleocarpae TaxID=2591008 RepID=A0A545U3W1_9GAMM|nr:fused response regulator/phosphatase [Exilibacterium tricleocarpae]TQV84171.1 fused response regulator/phosphatase [Exilibacterium tricleocarpae]
MTNAEGKYVLVADDDRNSLDLISTLLEYAGYRCVLANNGKEAVELFEAHKGVVFLVLLDAMMPEMDGFEASAQIRRMAGDAHIPILFITSLSKKDQVVRCLSVGDDIITKPFQHEILSAKVRVHSRIADLCREVQEQNRQLSYYQKQIEMEHDVTEHFFNNFLSIGVAQNQNIRSYSSPLSRFNGDVLLVTPSANGCLYFFLGDVTGHGLPAAVSSVPASCAFQVMAKKGLSVSQIAEEMNRFSRKVLPPNMMMAGTIGRLEGNGRRLQLWAGGMPDILHVDERGSLLSCIQAWHLPLGVEEDDQFRCDVKTLELPLNSRLIMYTDGIIESRNRRGEQFGEDRLLTACQGANSSPFDSILAAVSAFREDLDQSDDITLLELVLSPFAETEDDEPAPEPAHRRTEVPWTLTATLGVRELKSDDPLEFLSALALVDRRLDGLSGVCDTAIRVCFEYCLDRTLLGLPAPRSVQQAGSMTYLNERRRRIAQLQQAQIAITLAVSSGDGKAALVVEIENRTAPHCQTDPAQVSVPGADTREAATDPLEPVRRVVNALDVEQGGRRLRAKIETDYTDVVASEPELLAGIPLSVSS